MTLHHPDGQDVTSGTNNSSGLFSTFPHNSTCLAKSDAKSSVPKPRAWCLSPELRSTAPEGRNPPLLPRSQTTHCMCILS